MATTALTLLGGSETAAVLGAPAEELGSIVRLRSRLRDSSLSSCTATLIARGALLTASHCIDASVSEIELTLGERTIELGLSGVHPHLERDLAVLRFASSPELDALVPLATITKPTTWQLREVVQIAGYGDPSGDLRPPLTFAAEEVVDVSTDHLVVSGAGFSGACHGDSGGPLLTRNEDGRVRVAAVLSRGHVSCWGEDEYIRVDDVLDWLLSLELPAADPAASACEGLPSEGMCRGNTAVYCGPDGPVAMTCSTTDVCGWSFESSGYRCVHQGRDPCSGVGDLGSCLDGIALRCDGGELIRSFCEACGGECVRSPQSGRTTCF